MGTRAAPRVQVHCSTDFVFISMDVKTIKKEVLLVGFMDYLMLRVEVGAERSSMMGWGLRELNVSLLEEQVCEDFRRLYRGCQMLTICFKTQWECWQAIKQKPRFFFMVKARVFYGA